MVRTDWSEELFEYKKLQIYLFSRIPTRTTQERTITLLRYKYDRIFWNLYKISDKHLFKLTVVVLIG